ncbi:MAG: hypothetical protein QNJ91_02310 [Gammaproteobacteria bacterium]|nr:hypothetical protein [Gammaproteobacteria bacterium]
MLTDNDDRSLAAPTLATPDALTRLCGECDPQRGIDHLVAAVNRLMPTLRFKHALSRGGWHRLGGVVDHEYRRVAGNIVDWVEHEYDGDIDELVASYVGSGFFATRLTGTTHYLTAARSDSPHDFVQIEVEELQEALDRPLVDQDWCPDSVEEFLEPIDYPRVEPEPVAPAHFQFRRITVVGDLIGSATFSRQIDSLCRFFADWSVSSAGEHASFCDHWVLSLREYRDREGLPQLMAKPVATFSGEPPELPHSEGVRGAALANAIHAYDRSMGYPFAWYFMMLGQKAGNYALADAVLADQMGAYEYLCARDLRVLRDWEERPYGV